MTAIVISNKPARVPAAATAEPQVSQGGGGGGPMAAVTLLLPRWALCPNTLAMPGAEINGCWRLGQRQREVWELSVQRVAWVKVVRAREAPLEAPTAQRRSETPQLLPAWPSKNERPVVCNPWHLPTPVLFSASITEHNLPCC